MKPTWNQSTDHCNKYDYNKLQYLDYKANLRQTELQNYILTAIIFLVYCFAAMILVDAIKKIIS